MRTSLAFRVVCAALLIAQPRGTSAQSTPPDRAADAALIRAQIEDICQAFVDKDRRRLVETHGKDWRGFTPWSGHVIRGLDGYMNEATFEPGTAKGQGMIGYRLSDFDVVFYGDTAVASFVLDTDVVYGTEKGAQKLTILDVFHNGPNGWIQVASNTSLHPDGREDHRLPVGTQQRPCRCRLRDFPFESALGAGLSNTTEDAEDRRKNPQDRPSASSPSSVVIA
jgi:hypothetical protein